MESAIELPDTSALSANQYGIISVARSKNLIGVGSRRLEEDEENFRWLKPRLA